MAIQVERPVMLLCPMNTLRALAATPAVIMKLA
jgi:hypothetical protein